MASNWTKIFKFLSPTAPIGWLADLIGGNITSLFQDAGSFAHFLTEKTGNALGENVLSGLTSQVGANLSPAQRESAEVQYQNTRLLRQTEFADTVRSMEDAGLNPQAMYGSISGPSSSTAGMPSSGGSLSDLIALATLPAQLRNLEAQTRHVNADSDLVRQKTLTEEQITKLQSIAVQWQPTINGETVAQLSANIDNIMADTDYKRAQKDYVNTQEVAQSITNEYLPKRMLSEIGNLDASARNSRASAAITEVEAKFAKDNGFLMSNNDMLLLGTYIASLFSVEKSDVIGVVQNGVKYVKEELPKDFRPWRKVSEDEAMNYFLEHAKHASKD